MKDSSPRSLLAPLPAAEVDPAICVRIERWSGPEGAEKTSMDDWVASESPLEVRLEGRPSTVLMRTPGHDQELVRGFLYTEGVVTSADDIAVVSPAHLSPDDVGGSIVNVKFASSWQERTLERSFISNASCGVCGKKSIESLEVHGDVADAELQVSKAVLFSLPARLKAAQATFATTGGVHASGLFTPAGELQVLREDVGRHNALDKIVGWAMLEKRLPLAGCVLLVSGRVSYEIVQKAVAAAIPFVAAVGAPSSLAVELAERFHVTLVGFLKPASLNVYSHPERIRHN